MYGFIFEGKTYDEYVNPPEVHLWSAYHFTCHINVNPCPGVSAGCAIMESAGLLLLSN
jgi:hypothetical protein